MISITRIKRLKLKSYISGESDPSEEGGLQACSTSVNTSQDHLPRCGATIIMQRSPIPALSLE